MDLDAEYRAHVGDLVRFATVLVGPDDAPDVVSDAIAATIARGSAQSADHLRAYWFGAVANTAADWHRRSARRTARERQFAARGSTSWEPASGDEARGLLAGLTTQQRAVVYLTYWLDWPPARVASALGVGEGTVKKQLGRARQSLREVVGDGIVG